MNPPCRPCAHTESAIPDGWSRRRALAALLAGGLLAGCEKPRKQALRLGINDFPSYELLYLASEKGYYAEEGVDVRIVEFSSLTDTVTALRNRQIDGAATSLVDFLVAQERDRVDGRIVRVLDFTIGADVIIGRPEVGSIKGLRGRKVAVEQDSLGLFVLGRALQMAGMALGDVTLVNADQMSGEQEYASGGVDAFVTYPPTSKRVMGAGRSIELWNSSAAPGEILDVVMVSNAVLRERADDVARMLRGIDRAQAYLGSHPADALAIMARRERVPPEELAASLRDEMRLISAQDQARYLDPGAVVHRQLDLAGGFLQSAGVLKRRPDVDRMFINPARMGASNGL